VDTPFAAEGPTASGGGNHRGSIFRLIVGASLIRRDGRSHATWGGGNNASREIRDGVTGDPQEQTAANDEIRAAFDRDGTKILVLTRAEIEAFRSNDDIVVLFE
jgi:hypothetical protein